MIPVISEKKDRGFFISLDGGKYKIFYNWSRDGQFEAKRYNMNWRDLVGDKLIMNLCQEIIELSKRPQTVNTLDEELKEAFESHMCEVQDDYPDLEHGILTKIAAEHVIESISGKVYAIADDRKWGHIEEVNKAHFGG